mmetsp:Transcript_2016/g.4438  ORF Transcript_2016/g.4438 Transcript_2016/m.4438 type:complete len:135 (-) Transcript_2016:8-412(-)
MFGPSTISPTQSFTTSTVNPYRPFPNNWRRHHSSLAAREFRGTTYKENDMLMLYPQTQYLLDLAFAVRSSVEKGRARSRTRRGMNYPGATEPPQNKKGWARRWMDGSRWLLSFVDVEDIFWIYKCRIRVVVAST